MGYDDAETRMVATFMCGQEVLVVYLVIWRALPPRGNCLRLGAQPSVVGSRGPSGEPKHEPKHGVIGGLARAKRNSIGAYLPYRDASSQQEPPNKPPQHLSTLAEKPQAPQSTTGAGDRQESVDYSPKVVEWQHLALPSPRELGEKLQPTQRVTQVAGPSAMQSAPIAVMPIRSESPHQTARGIGEDREGPIDTREVPPVATLQACVTSVDGLRAMTLADRMTLAIGTTVLDAMSAKAVEPDTGKQGDTFICPR